MKKIFSILLITMLLLTGCMGNSKIDPNTIDYIQLKPPTEGDDIAVFDTSMGEITVLLYTNEVPEIVQNFKDLVNEGYYDGQVMFRVEPDYKLSAFGSSDRFGKEGKTNEDKPKKAEFSQNLWPFSGSLFTITYQSGTVFKSLCYDSRSFFLGDIPLTEEDRQRMIDYSSFPVMMRNAFEKVGGVPGYSQYHSVYGKVIKGMDVVNSMLQVETVAEEPTEKEIKAAEKQGIELIPIRRPKEDIVINKVTLKTYNPDDFETLDNCLSEEEFNSLVEKSEKEQAELDAILAGETIE